MLRHFARGFVLGWVLTLCACGGGDPPPTDDGVDPGEPVRWWSFSEFHVGTADEQTLLAEGMQIGGTLLENRLFGPVQEYNDHGVGLNPHDDGEANGQIFSDPTGATYWVWAQAPNDRSVRVTGSVVGNFTKLVQVQRFRKLTPGATFRYVVSDAFAYAFDGNNRRSLCPGSNPYCDGVLRAMVSIEVRAAAVLDDGLSTLASTFHHAAGILSLEGYTNNWEMGANTYKYASNTLWSDADFIQDHDISQLGDGQFATIALIKPLPIDVDISSVAVGGEFDVLVSAWTSVRDGRGRESYLSAFLKDPRLTTGGVGFESTGLRSVKSEPSTIPAGLNGPGTIEFLRPAYQAEESVGQGGAEIAILRIGGSRGEVSVTFSTADGSAAAAADYEAQHTVITFKDGDDAPRFVRVPLVQDALVEGPETVQLALSEPLGGAVLGAQSNAELQILNSQPTSAFTIGGTLTGLAGSGLVLDGPFGSLSPTAIGPFTMPGTLVDTLPYTVRVLHQPENPAQVCTVTNGSGLVAGANVTNVQVDCVTTAPVAGLDASFGSGGKVGIANPGGVGEALAVQPDGKILVAASGTGNFTLVRLLSGGTLDTGFGSGGSVSTDFGGSDDAYGVALQADGRIVVVGRVQIAGNYDFGIARYESNGLPDASFGNGGKLNIDFAGGTDYAQAVVIQADGKIVVGGQAALAGGNTFAILRLTSSGALDTAFGSGGKVQTALGSSGNAAYDLALAADGKLVLAGYSTIGTNEQFTAVRYAANGSLDLSFGTQGIARVPVQLNARARAVQVLADGSVLLAGGSAVGFTNAFGVVKLDAQGQLDAGFGSGGVVTRNFSGGRDYGRALAVQADGRIVVAGDSDSAAGYDIAVLRFLPNGAPDTTFGSGGVLQVDHAGGIDLAYALALQPDGRILAAGQGINGRTPEIVVLRVLP